MMRDSMRENPILGLGTQQQPNFERIKRKVDRIRQQQQQVFLEQFQRFPDVGPEGGGAQADDYGAVWESFQRKDDDVRDLMKRMQELNRLIDSVNKLGGGEQQ